jgi:hypothetical protein
MHLLLINDSTLRTPTVRSSRSCDCTGDGGRAWVAAAESTGSLGLEGDGQGLGSWEREPNLEGMETMADDQQTWGGKATPGAVGGGRATTTDLSDMTTAGATPGTTATTGGSTEQAGSPVGQAASQVKSAAGQTAQQAQQAAAPITDQVQQTAGQVADQAKQQALTQASTQKEHAAGSLDAVAVALRQSSDQLRDKQQEPLAHLANTAAGRVEQFSGYLRNTDVQDMVRDVEQFAHRQPAAFIGGAFTLGILAARFLKSSGQASTGTQSSGGRTPSYAGYSGRGAYAATGYPTPDTYASGAANPALGNITGAGAGVGPSTMGQDTRESTIGSTDDPTGIGSNPTGTSTATTGGWGYVPRRPGVEREGR